MPSPKPVKSVTRLPKSLSKKRRNPSLVRSPAVIVSKILTFACVGRAKKRLLYNRRFKTAVVGFGKKGVRLF